MCYEMFFSYRVCTAALAALLGSATLNINVVHALSSLAAVEPKSIVNKAVPGLKNGMDYNKLGSSDLDVSRVCMGTMTFGEVRYTNNCA